MKHCPAIFVVLLGLLGWTQADSGQIRDVTVFPGGALVTRVATVEATSRTALFNGLPGDLDEQSVRAELVGATGRIVAIELDEVEHADLVREGERKLSREVERLTDDLRRHDDRIKVAQLRLGIIEAFGEEGAATARSEVGRGELHPETWATAWRTLEDGAEEALETIHSAEIQRREVEAELDKVRRQLDQIQSGARDQYKASVQFESTDAGKVTVAITYRVDDAEWQPYYNAWLDTESQTVTLALIAEISQNSGEDWEAVRLTLSPVAPSNDCEIPELDPWFLDFRSLDDTHSRSLGAINIFDGTMADNSYIVQGLNSFGGFDSEYASEHEITTASNIPSDNDTHRIQIAVYRMPAIVGATIVPRIERSAYLTAEVTFGGDVVLMPGDIALHVDGAAVGTGFLDRLRPGAQANLVFGVDHRLLVSFSEEPEKRSEAGMFSKQRQTERWSEAKVMNRHGFPVSVEILDRLPVARDTQISVDLLAGTDAPSEVNIDDSPGVLAWRQKLAAGEEMKIRFGYTVSYPEGQKIPGL